MSTETPKILKVDVAEVIKTDEAGMGIPTDPNFPPTSPVPGEVEKIAEAQIATQRELAMKLLERYVVPHRIKSRWVMPEDMERLILEGMIMHKLCAIPRGVYQDAAAIAHPQIEDKDPMRFFVLSHGMFIINPVIVRHTKTIVDKLEGCMTYPEEPMIQRLPRYHKITVRYQTLLDGEPTGDGTRPMPILSKPAEVEYSGRISEVFQHEICHLNGVYIYDKDYNPHSCYGLGDETPIDDLHKENLQILD